MNAGPAQIGVYQKHSRALLRQYSRGVDAGRSLAFLRKRAGNNDSFRRRSDRCEQERGPQRTIRLRHLRLRPRQRD